MQGASRRRGQGISTNPQRDAVCFHRAANCHFGESQKLRTKGPGSPPAHDQSLPGRHGHSHPPPLPLPPAGFAARWLPQEEQRRSFVSSTAKSFCAHPARGIVNTCRVYVGPTAQGDSSVPPTLATRSCSGGFPEPHFRCSWAPGKGTKEPFSSPASPGAEGEGERKEQCLQNTTIGRKFSSGFLSLGFSSPPLLSLFLF